MRLTESAAPAPAYGAGAAGQRPDLDYRCGTCGATFTTGRQLGTHLAQAYHGFQCLACGAVHATRGAFEDHIHRTHQPPGLPRGASPTVPGARGGQAPHLSAHVDDPPRRALDAM